MKIKYAIILVLVVILIGAGIGLKMFFKPHADISCQLDSSWAAANQETIESLEAGNPVTVKGICKGYLMEIKVSPAIVVK